MVGGAWLFFEIILGVELYLYSVTCDLGNGVCGAALTVFAYLVGYIILETWR